VVVCYLWGPNMNRDEDPFLHCPGLRDKISDPLKSSFRTFSVAILEQRTKELGLETGWWYTDSEREATRAQALLGHMDNDLWVFGYGSLMWDPAFRFAEVRRAHVSDYERRFILKDVFGGRGNRDAPGLMAALDPGNGCEGLLFRIAAENVDEETEVIWRREKVGPAYKAEFVDADIKDKRVQALTFVADHDAKLIDASLTRAQQIEYLATGSGFLGTSLEYLQNIADQFALMGIEDEEVTALLNETKSYISSH